MACNKILNRVQCRIELQPHDVVTVVNATTSLVTRHDYDVIITMKEFRIC